MTLAPVGTGNLGGTVGRIVIDDQDFAREVAGGDVGGRLLNTIRYIRFFIQTRHQDYKIEHGASPLGR